MFRSVALSGVAVAALASGCCWRPCCGTGSVYNPPHAPLFPRLHAGFGGPSPVAGPVGSPDCPGCVGGVPPAGGVPFASGGVPYGVGGPVAVMPPPGPLAYGPQYSPTVPPPPASTALPPPKEVGGPPSTMPTAR